MGAAAAAAVWALEAFGQRTFIYARQAADDSLDALDDDDGTASQVPSLGDWRPRPAEQARREEARVAQGARLRRLLLQRALPEHRWGLIGGAEAGCSRGARRVLCDALLEGR